MATLAVARLHACHVLCDMLNSVSGLHLFLQLPKRETAFLSFPRKGFLPAGSHFFLPVAGSQEYPKMEVTDE